MGQVKDYGTDQQALAKVYNDQGYNVMLREPKQ